MLSALVAGMTTPQAVATVVAAAYASYCALRYVYRRALTGVAHTQAPAHAAARGRHARVRAPGTHPRWRGIAGGIPWPQMKE